MRSNSANLVGAPLSIYMAFQFENYLARPNDILGDIDFTDKKYLPYWITYTALFIGIPWTSYEFLPMSEWTLAMDERHREERIENLYGFLETLTKKVNIVIVDDIDLDELQDSLRMNEWIAN